MFVTLNRIHVPGLTRLLPESSIQLGSPSFDYSCDVDSIVVINVWVICTTSNAEPKSSCALEKKKKTSSSFSTSLKNITTCHTTLQSNLTVQLLQIGGYLP